MPPTPDINPLFNGAWVKDRPIEISTPQAPPPAAPDPHPYSGYTFTTERGNSVYTINPDGTTQRVKGASGGVHEGDVGLKPASQRTVYVSPKAAERLGGLYASHSWGPQYNSSAEIVPDQNAIRFNFYRGLNEQGTPRGYSQMIPYSTTPEVGMHPFEELSGNSKHLGSRITSLNLAASEPTVAPKMVAPAPGSEMFQRSMSFNPDAMPQPTRFGKPSPPIPGGEHGGGAMPSGDEGKANYPPEKSIEELLAEKLYERAQAQRANGSKVFYPFESPASAAAKMFHPEAANPEYLNPSMWLPSAQLEGVNPSLHAYLTDYATSATPPKQMFSDDPNVWAGLDDLFDDYNPSDTRALSVKESEPIRAASKKGNIVLSYYDEPVDLTDPEFYKVPPHERDLIGTTNKRHHHLDLIHLNPKPDAVPPADLKHLSNGWTYSESEPFWDIAPEHVANLSNEYGDWTLYHPTEHYLPDPTAKYRITGGEHQFVVPSPESGAPVGPPIPVPNYAGGQRPSPIIGAWDPNSKSMEELPYRPPNGGQGWRRGSAPLETPLAVTGAMGNSALMAVSAYYDAIQQGATHDQAMHAAKMAGGVGLGFSALGAVAPRVAGPLGGAFLGADAAREATRAFTGEEPTSRWVPTVGGIAGVASMFNPYTRAATMGYGAYKLAAPLAKAATHYALGSPSAADVANNKKREKAKHRAMAPNPTQYGVRPPTPEEEAIRNYVQSLPRYTPPRQQDTPFGGASASGHGSSKHAAPPQRHMLPGGF